MRAQQASAASSKVCFEVADKSGFGCPAMVRRFGALSHTKPTVTREEGACDRGGSQSPPKSGRAGGCAASPRGVKCEKDSSHTIFQRIPSLGQSNCQKSEADETWHSALATDLHRLTG